MARSTGHPQWPPEIPEEQLIDQHNYIKDYQITHGSLVKLFRTDEGHSVRSQPIGVSMFPTLFPRSCFHHALELQNIFNELYVSVAEDEEWIERSLKSLIDSDPFTQALWSIHQEVSREGYLQPLNLGIFRSDYMLQQGSSHEFPKPPLTLKQVEFNTFSVAGGSHANIVADLHQEIARSGLVPQTEASWSSLPKNTTINSLVSALAMAHNAYRKSATVPKPPSSLDAAVLMIVQPHNINICDERPIEYGLRNRHPPISVFRLEFNNCILSHVSLDESRRLLFKPYPNSQPKRAYEVSVVYYRAGYEAEEYSATGKAARLLFERSAAIKCPSVLSHLTTFKKVQQALALPGTLQRFLTDADKAALVADTFAPLLPLDASELGTQTRALATDPAAAATYILKPSLEGGGHNVYGAAIPAFLRTAPHHLWPHYILQELITPPAHLTNILLSHRGIHRGPVVSELGVFGAVLWRRKEVSGGVEILHNSEAGWSFKTKAADVDEMSVIKGYGCFDCPYLVDDNYL